MNGCEGGGFPCAHTGDAYLANHGGRAAVTVAAGTTAEDTVEEAGYNVVRVPFVQSGLSTATADAHAAAGRLQRQPTRLPSGVTVNLMANGGGGEGVPPNDALWGLRPVDLAFDSAGALLA